MTTLLKNGQIYELRTPDKEDELEKNVISNASAIFGNNRHYIDTKRQIGDPSLKTNIIDGLLVDLSSKDPKLYIIENEISSHRAGDIAKQILEFAISFGVSLPKIRQITYQEITKHKEVEAACLEYVSANGYRGIDHLVAQMTLDNKEPFHPVVVIDELESLLIHALRMFEFKVDTVQLRQYINSNGDSIFEIESSFQDVQESLTEAPSTKPIDVSEFDTVIVPARIDGFEQTFLAKNEWYAIRIHSSMRDPNVLRYIAAYQVAPTSAITHYAEIDDIQPYEDSGKFRVIFKSPAQKIGPIKLDTDMSGQGIAPQGPRYTTFTRLKAAKTMSDLLRKNYQKTT